MGHRVLLYACLLCPLLANEFVYKEKFRVAANSLLPNNLSRSILVVVLRYFLYSFPQVSSFRFLTFVLLSSTHSLCTASILTTLFTE